MSRVFNWRVWNFLFGLNGSWFVNDDIDGDDIASLLRLCRKPSNKRSLSKDIHSYSIDPNFPCICLNYKKMSQDISPSQ